MLWFVVSLGAGVIPAPALASPPFNCDGDATRCGPITVVPSVAGTFAWSAELVAADFRPAGVLAGSAKLVVTSSPKKAKTAKKK